jgi:peptidoglycan-associated lipoprotein
MKTRSFIFLLGILASVVLMGACHKTKIAAAPPPPPPPAATPAPPAAPTVTLTAEPSTIEKGHSVTLSWTSENATSLDLEPHVGTVQATGSTTVTPDDSTTYILTVSGPGGKDTASARVTVILPPPPPPPSGPSVSETTLEQMFSGQVQDVYFDFDKSDIRADAQTALAHDAEFLKQHPEISFTIAGHCDERGSEEYNLGLGDRRATAAKSYLINLGIPASRISTISYGKDRPFCTEHTEDCWQQNRRDHLTLGAINR